MTSGKYLPFLILFSMLIACGSDDEKATPDVPASGTVPTPSQPTTPPAAASDNTTAPAAQNIALNPAHGLPGHRCDIPVGTPLNSAPGKTVQTAPPAQAAPVANPTPAKSVINTGTAATGLNPAHGQPGHRCDIAVGAPLNSKPQNQ